MEQSGIFISDRLRGKLMFAALLSDLINQKQMLLLPEFSTPSIIDILNRKILRHNEISKEIGISESYLSKIVHLLRKPSYKLQKKLTSVVLREFYLYRAKEIIETTDLSCRTIALKFGYSQPYLSQLLMGTRKPSYLNEFVLKLNSIVMEWMYLTKDFRK